VTGAPSSPTWSAEREDRAARAHAARRRALVARPVALVGFMGAGKSAVGRELAVLVDRPFVDTDALVEQRAGASVAELFARGEPAFRALEHDAVRAALGGPPAVLALGGGAFAHPASARLLLEEALVVHLAVPWSAVRPLLAGLAEGRPLLRDRAPWEVEDLYLRRAAVYRSAHLRVSPPRTSPAEAARVVAAVLGVGPS